MNGLNNLKRNNMKGLNYYKNNAEEDYLGVPISVLRYIDKLEKQQKRSYSEEELIILLKKFKKDIINSTELDDDFETLVCDIKTKKWFEQFKKK